MTDRKGKRAVIINHIASESIEQAIFILKPQRSENLDVGQSIVAEAQEIINSYIMRVERGNIGSSISKRKKLAIFGCILGALLIATVLFFLRV